MRQSRFGLHFILAQTRPTAKCRLAQTLGRRTETPLRATASELKRKLIQQQDFSSATAGSVWRSKLSKSRHGTRCSGSQLQRVGQLPFLQQRLNWASPAAPRLMEAASSSSWLALRASVLRRAVSLLARPLLHCQPSSVTVGREATQHLRGLEANADLNMFRTSPSQIYLPCSTSLWHCNPGNDQMLRLRFQLEVQHLYGRRYLLGGCFIPQSPARAIV